MRALISQTLTIFVGLAVVLAPEFSLADGPVTITPDTLRDRIVSANIPVAMQLNELQQAKTTVNESRDNLFPSIKITLGASFVMTAVACLLPFLLPTNWIALAKSKHLLKSEEKAFGLMQYNTYATAYSTLELMVEDQRLLSAQQELTDNFNTILNIVKEKRKIGFALNSDVEYAEANAKNADESLQNIELKWITDQTALRQALAYGPDQQLVIPEQHVAPSPAENSDVDTVIKQALGVSLEYAQMDDLIAAAKDDRWSAAFGWLSSASLSAQSSGSGGSASFGNLQPVGQIGLGFATIDAVQLANQNVDQVKLQKKEVELEQEALVEGLLPAIPVAEKKIADSSTSEADMLANYQTEMEAYKAGLTDLLHLMTAANAYATAKIQRINDETDLDEKRITLHRILLTDEFAKIGGCQVQNLGDRRAATLEQLCRPAVPQQ